MRNGTCTKCGVRAVAVARSAEDRTTRSATTLGVIATRIYACAECGFVETYLDGTPAEVVRGKGWTWVSDPGAGYR